jgi:fibronectin type 3 domain-containing protein
MRRAILLPYSGSNQIQVFLDAIDAMFYDGSNYVNLVTSNPTATLIPATDATDAAAILAQINAAYLATAPMTIIPGSPAPVTSGPTGLAATGDYGQIVLTWTAASSPNYAYNVYRSKDNVTFTKLASTSAATYTDSTVVAGTTYYYTVTIYTVRGESPQTASVSAAGLIPTAPTGLAATTDYYQSDLSWSAVAGDTLFPSVTYNLYRNGSVVCGTSSLTYQDAGLTAATTYSYTVSAVINGVEGPQCAAVTCTPNALTAPSGVEVTQGYYAATVSWTAPAGATAFNLYRGTASGTATLCASGISGTDYTDTGLRYDATYFYKVTATANSGESPQSGEVNVQPNAATFASCSPNPTSVNDGLLTFTGTGFDPSQGGVLQFGTVSVTQFACQYLSSTQLTITYPGGMTPGAVQFYYNVAGSLYELPFTVTFD